MTAEGSLTYSTRAVPFSVLAALRLYSKNVELQGDSALPKDAVPTLTLSDGSVIEGVPAILRHVAQSPPCPSLALTPETEYWIDASSLLSPGAGLASAAAALSRYLELRTYVCGNAFSLADAAVWGPLQSNLQWDKLRKSEGASVASAGRWYDFVCKRPELEELAETLGPRRRYTTPKPTSVPELAGAVGGGDVGSFDIGLEGAVMGKVVTRFPPEPSGYLHIGHAKAVLLNQHIAEMYRGSMRVRFDDTNPSKEKHEFTQSILEDVATLGARYAGAVTYTSDYFEQMLRCTQRLIAAGHVYADDTPLEQMRAERMDGIKSGRRDEAVAWTEEAFGEMLAASERGLTLCLRIKLDYTCPNKAMRDPVIWRCNLEPHWRTGTQWKCYPMYDFACPFVDALEGITHALRTSEYKDREAQYYAILALQQGAWPGLPDVKLWDYSRLAFVHTVMSKRKLTRCVDGGYVDGWDDPRMPTVRGIMRRGLQIPALREFILGQGASKNMTMQEWDKLWATNKKLIDPVCPRHTAVDYLAKVAVRLTNFEGQGIEYIVVPKHAKHPPAGTKRQARSATLLIDAADAEIVTAGEEVTLMGWGNAVMEKLHRDEEGKVTAIDARLHLEGDFKKTKLKLTWLAEVPQLVPLEVHVFGHLIAKRKLEEDDELEAWINTNSRFVSKALGDENMADLEKNDVLQLERKGYYRVEKPAGPNGEPLVLFHIPDGKQKAVGAA